MYFYWTPALDTTVPSRYFLRAFATEFKLAGWYQETPSEANASCNLLEEIFIVYNSLENKKNVFFFRKCFFLTFSFTYSFKFNELDT